MKKWVVIIAMLLAVTQVWGGDNAYTIKMDRTKLDFIACAREYEQSTLRVSIDHAFSMAENKNNNNKLDDCEAKLDEYIGQAANGDDAINDGLMSIISYMATDESSSRKIFAQKYERKLQMAKQSATKKAPSTFGDKGSDKKKTEHE